MTKQVKSGPRIFKRNRGVYENLSTESFNGEKEAGKQGSEG